MPFTLINTAEALAALCDRFSTRTWLAVDTEFVRVDTYRAKLCLVQLGDGETHACIDVLALPDLSTLWTLLGNPKLIKVLHSASQDYEIFVEHTSRCPAPLFDTQTAATLLGIGDQIGYAGLVEKLLGIAVDKSLSRTDWARRPLSQAELAYAAGDVEHLAALYPMLHQRLAEAGRLAWLAEDCARVCDPALYATPPENAWKRLKGLARMPVRAQHLAAALAAWRETEAQARNRPRKWIVEDDAIYRIAEREPADLPALQALGVLPPKTLEKHGETLLGVIAQAKVGTQSLAEDGDLSPEQKSAFTQLQGRVRSAAERLNVPATYIGPKADLMEVVLRGPAAQAPLTRGWRAAAISGL